MLDTQTALLHRALEIAGGEVQLAAQLGVPETRLRFWLAKKARLPDDVFLLLVDIVLRDDVARAASDRRREPRSSSIESEPSEK